MLVGELIETLQELNPEMIVVMSSDAEGNSYSPLSGVDGENNVYIPDSTWSGEVRLASLTEELELAGYGEDDVYDGPDGIPAVVIWPVN